MDLQQFFTVMFFSSMIFLRLVTSQNSLSDLRSGCPDGWLEERDQCYRPIPSCLSLFSNEEKEAFCRAVLGADIGYVNGVLSCVSDLRIPESVLMQILEPKSSSSLSKRDSFRLKLDSWFTALTIIRANLYLPNCS